MSAGNWSSFSPTSSSSRQFPGRRRCIAHVPRTVLLLTEKSGGGRGISHTSKSWEERVLLHPLLHCWLGHWPLNRSRCRLGCRVGWEIVLDGGAHGRQLANTIERFVRAGSDAGCRYYNCSDLLYYLVNICMIDLVSFCPIILLV